MTAFNKDEFNALLLSDFTKKGRSNSINLDNYLDVVNEVIQTYNLNNPDNQIEFNKESFKALLPKLSSAVIQELSTEINPLDVFKNSGLAYNYMQLELKKEIINFSYLNRIDKSYIKNDDDTNTAIIQYKNRLFNKLLEFIGESDQNLYELSGAYNGDLYQSVMKSAFDKFNYPLETFENNVILNSEIRNRYDVFNALYILNNFDKVIKKELGESIKINEDYMDYLETGAENKYSFKSSVLQTAFFSDDTHQAKDAKLMASPLIRLITETIPYYNASNQEVPGESLGMNRFIKFGSLIADLEFSLDTDIFKNTFNENPREFIITLFNSLSDNQAQTLFQSNKDLFYSLKNYLGKDSVIAIATRKETKLNEENLTNFIDFHSLLAFELSKSWSPKYIVYDQEKGEIDIKDFNNFENTSGTVLDVIDGTLRSLVNSSIKPIPTNSRSAFKAYFNKYTGLDITPLLEKHNEEDIFSFLNTIIDRLTLMKKDSDPKANYKDFDSKNENFNKIVNTLVSANKFLPMAVFPDSNGNGIPVNRQSSMSSNFRHNIKAFSKYNAGISNIFVDNLQLSGNPYIRLELISKNSEQGIAADEMSIQEDLYSSFVYDFLKASKKGLFLTQPVAYSDKSTNSLIPIKLDQPVMGDLNFNDLSNKQLKELYYQNEKEYFESLMLDITGTWAELLNLDSITVDTLNEKLATLNDKDIEKLLHESFKKGKYIEITEEYHFVRYKEGDKTKIQLNRDLFSLNSIYESQESFEKYHLQNYLNFQKKLGEVFEVKTDKGTIIDFRLDYNKDLFTISGHPDFDESNKKKFTSITSKSIEQDKPETTFPFFISKNGERVYGNSYNLDSLYSQIQKEEIILNPYYDRFLLMTNFVTSQYLAINSKHPYLYAAKGLNTGTDLNKEKSLRLDAMSKRMVQYPATKMRYLKNKLNGVGSSMKVAVVNDYVMKVETASGFSTKQDTTDGGAYIGPITSYLQENSLPASGIKGVQKPINISLSKGRSSMLKFAQNPITNEMIRTSRTADIPYGYMIKKMYDIKWDKDYNVTENLYGNAFSTYASLKNTGQSALFSNINGNYYSIDIVSKVGKHQYEVSYQKVDKFGNDLNENYIKTVNIDSIYTLWKALGGENSMSLTSKGLVYSDLSWQSVTSYVNNVGDTNDIASVNTLFKGVNQPLKSQMIDMIAFKSSMKNGATNVNSSDVLFNNNNLLYFNFDLSNSGVQQNQNHIADESMVSQPTQVISALASLGYTFDTANEIYQEMSKLIDKVAEEFKIIIDSNDKELLYNHLAKLMTKVFNEADRLGNGQNYIEIINKKIQEDPNLKIPFSNPNLFGLFTSTIVSKVNRDIFRKKFAGIAATLNLSAGSKQVYNNSGLFMDTSDIYDEVVELLQNPNPNEKDIELKNELLRLTQIDGKPVLEDVSNQLINTWIAYKNPNIPNFSSNDLELYDRISSPTNLELDGRVYNEGEEIYIDSPYKLKSLIKLNIPVTKINSKSRDLKPSEITWFENENLIKPSDNIIWGHPGIGKTTALINNPDLFIDWDNEFNEKRDKWIETKSKTKKGTPEFKKAKNEYLINYQNHKDFIKFVSNEWEKAKTKALKENKKLLASPHMLLNLFEEDFNKIINVPDDVFIQRNIERGEGDENTSRLWKDGINETLSKINPSKIITTEKFIDEILKEVKSIKRNFWTTDAMMLIGSNFEKLNPDMSAQLSSYLNYLGHPELIGKTDNESLDNIQKLVQKWVHRTTSLLKRGLNYRPIEEFKLEDGTYDFKSYFLNDNLSHKFELNYTSREGFIPIQDLKISKYEGILPKVYRTALNIGDNSLYKIMKQGVNYYKPIVSKMYEESSSTTFFIRSKNLNLPIDLKDKTKYNKDTIKKNFYLKTEIELNTVTKKEEEVTYRVNQSGQKLYVMPAGSEIHTIDGKDILVLNNYKESDINKIYKSIKGAYNIEFSGSNDLSALSSLNVLKLMRNLNTLPFYKKQYDNLYKENYKLLNTNNDPDVSFNTYKELYKSLNLTRGNAAILSGFLSNNISLRNRFFTLDFIKNELGQEESVYVLNSNISEELIKTTKDSFDDYLKTLKNTLNENTINTFINTKKERIESIAQMMYSTFVKTQEFVSSRIPAQALQSFMAMQNVAFTNDESNNMFVSIWQLVLQGSDFDIDKAFNIMYDIDDNGIYKAWSPLFDYSSPEALTLSEQLPTPTGKEITVEKITDVNNLTNEYINLDKFIRINNIKPNLQNTIDAIKKINDNEGFIFYTTLDDNFNLVGSINSHNKFKYSIEAGNNKIFSGIKNIITDLENKVSAESPIDMTAHQTPARKMDSALKSLEDGVSKWMIKRDNQVGKITVGPMANGAKVFFGLTQYFNSKYKKSNKLDLNTFFSRDFTFDGITYRKATIGDVYLNYNQKDIIRKEIERQIQTIKDITSYVDEFNNTVYTMPIKEGEETSALTFILDQDGNAIFSENDASLPISSLISAATDNAKELLLAKLNAGMDFAGMHIYLTILGFSVKQITDFMTHPAINEIAKNLSSDRFRNKPANKWEVIPKILKEFKFNNEIEKDIFIKQFNNISSGAEELQNANKFLGLNQGIKTSMDDIHRIITGMSKIPLNRQLELTGDIDARVKIVDFKKAILADKPYLSNDPEFHKTVDRLHKNGIIGYDVDMFKFINGDGKSEQYQKDIVDYYNLVKHTVNIFDLVLNLPHIKSLLVSFIYTTELLNKGTNKYRIAKQVPGILANYQSLIGSSDKKIAGLKYVRGKKNAGIKFDEKMYAKIIPLYDDMVILNWLKSDRLSKINFMVEDLKELTKDPVGLYKDIASNETINGAASDIIGLNNPVDIANFIRSIEKIIIPYLKQKYPNNKFLKDLIYEGKNKYSKKYRPKMNYSSMDQDEIKLLEYDSSLKAFNEISNDAILNEKFLVEGNPLTIGDIMFLYNTIVNKDRFGPARLTKIFDSYVKKENSLAQDLLFYYSKMENEVIELNPSDVLYTLFNKLEEDKKQVTIKNPQTGGDQTLAIGNDNYHFSIGSSDVILSGLNKLSVLFLEHFRRNTFLIELNCD